MNNRLKHKDIVKIQSQILDDLPCCKADRFLFLAGIVCRISVIFSLVCNVVLDDTEEGVRSSHSGSLKTRPPPKTAPKPTREPSKGSRNTKVAGGASVGMSVCLLVADAVL